MKILFFSHDSGLYGASRSLVNLIIGLNSSKYTCHVILPGNGPLVKLLDDFKIPYSIINFPHWTRIRSDKKYPLFIQYIIDKLLGFKSLIYLLIKLFLFFINGKALAIAKNYDIIVTNTSVIPNGSLCALFLSKPHIWYLREKGILHHNYQFILGSNYFCKLLKHSSLVIYNSNSVARFYSSLCKNPHLKGCVIYNGLYFQDEFREKIKLKSKITKRSDQFVFSIIGSIQENKGQSVAIEALSEIIHEFPEIKLWIVGDGQINKLKQFAKEKHIEKHVVFHGFVEDIESVYLNTDCLLVCSTHEAFGRTTVEAMAYGIPVIGKNDGGTSEIIEHEFTGLLYSGKLKELIECMKHIILNQTNAKKLGINGWQMAKDRYNIENYRDKFSEELIKLYQ